MIQKTFLARISDGLVLCESYSSAQQDNEAKLMRNAADQVFRHLKNLHAEGSIRKDQHVFHYSQSMGVGFVVLTELTYPAKLAIQYLREVAEAFESELANTYGSGSVNYESMIETINKPYQFVKFQRVLNAKTKQFTNAQSSENIKRLNNELVDVSNIIQESFQKLLERDISLKDMNEKAFLIKNASLEFKQNARKLKLRMLFQKYGARLAILLIILLFLYFKFA